MINYILACPVLHKLGQKDDGHSQSENSTKQITYDRRQYIGINKHRTGQKTYSAKQWMNFCLRSYAVLGFTHKHRIEWSFGGYIEG